MAGTSGRSMDQLEGLGVRLQQRAFHAAAALTFWQLGYANKNVALIALEGAVSLENRSQPPAAAMKGYLYVVNRDIENFCDLFLIEVEDLVKIQHDPMRMREELDLFLNAETHSTAFQRGFGDRRIAKALFLQFGQGNRRSAHLAEMVAAQVIGDLHKPGRQRGTVSESGYASLGPFESFLRQVIGDKPILHYGPEKSAHAQVIAVEFFTDVALRRIVHINCSSPPLRGSRDVRIHHARRSFPPPPVS